MAKQNAFLARMEAQYRAMSARKVNVALQMAKDVADISANEVFGMAEGRSELWTRVFSDNLSKMMEMVSSDGADDPEFIYAKTKIDERLKLIHGKHFQPWQVRYSE